MLFFIISFIVYWGRLRREPTVAANGEKQIWQNLIQIEKIISHTENSIFITHTDLTDLTDLLMAHRILFVGFFLADTFDCMFDDCHTENTESTERHMLGNCRLKSDSTYVLQELINILESYFWYLCRYYFGDDERNSLRNSSAVMWRISNSLKPLLSRVNMISASMV